MSISDDVAIQLQIKGVQEGEAQRLAGMTSRALEEELRASLRIQQSAYAASMAAISDMEKKSAAQTISQARANTKEIQTAYQLQESAAKHASAQILLAAKEQEEAHHRRVENFKNAAESAFIAYEAIKQTYEKFKQFGEEVIRTTQIYDGFTGSITAAQEATGGAVAKLDLIVAHNHMTELGLKLTDEQFAQVTARATDMAHKFAIDVPTAMDKLVDALALGKIKALDMAGITINADQAHEKFAKRLHLTADAIHGVSEKLSDQGKRTAVTLDALQQIADKSKGAAEGLEKPVTVAEALEKAFVGIKDTWNDIVHAIGSFKLPEWATHPKKTSDQEDIDNDSYDIMTGQLVYHADKKERAARKAVTEQRAAADAAAKADAAWKAGAVNGPEESVGDRLSGMSATKVGHAQTDVLDPISKAVQKTLQSRAAEKQELEDANRDLASLLDDPFKYLDDKTGPKPFVDSSNRFSIVDAYNSNQAGERNSHTGPMADNGHEMGPVFKSGDEYGAGKESRIKEESADAELRILLGLKDELALRKELEGVDKRQRDEETKHAEEVQSNIDRFRTEMGGMVEDLSKGQLGQMGIFEKLFFGEDGAEAMIKKNAAQAEEIKNVAKDVRDTFKGAGDSMAGAFGQSAAAAMGEGKNFASSLKQTEHAALMSISAQMSAKALLAGAEAVFDFASGNVAGGIAMTEAAGLFAAGAVAAGGLARATYSAPSAAASTPTSTRAGGSSSVGSSSSSSNSNGPQPVTIIVNGSIFSNKEELVKAVSAAAVEHFQINGKPAPGFV